MKIILSYSSELKDLVLAEAESLGAKIEQADVSSLIAEVDERAFYKMHLHNALADQIHLHVKTFSAKTPQMIFDQVKRIKWPEFINCKEGSSFALEFTRHIEDKKIFAKIVEGVLDSAKYYGKTEIKALPVEEADCLLVAHVDEKKGKMSLAVNTSGRSLHKRGHRPKGGGHMAPIKENKARALLHWAQYDGSKPFWDPFCGSGTIAIEAAYIALNKATHIHRPKDVFAFEKLPFFNRSLWRSVQEEARRQKENTLAPENFIRASDIMPEAIEMAKRNSLKARVEKYVQWGIDDFFKTASPSKNVKGLIVSNLPYDKRLPVADMENFYKKIGNHLKQHFAGWSACFLMAEETPWKAIGLRSTFAKTVFNGGIRCKFVRFDLY